MSDFEVLAFGEWDGSICRIVEDEGKYFLYRMAGRRYERPRKLTKVGEAFLMDKPRKGEFWRFLIHDGKFIGDVI